MRTLFTLALAVLFSCTFVHAAAPSITGVAGQPFPLGAGNESSYGIAYSPNGLWLASFNNGNYPPASTLSTYTVASDGSLSQTTGSPITVTAVPSIDVIGAGQYSPDNLFLVAPGSATNQINIFNVNQGNGNLTFLTAVGTEAIDLNNSIEANFSRNGEYIAVANWTESTISMFTFDVATGIPTFVQNVSLLDNVNLAGASFQMVSFSPDNRFLAVADGQRPNGGVAVLPVNGSGSLGLQNTTFIQDSAGISAVAYSPNGTFLAAANRGKTLYLFSVDPSTGALSGPSSIDLPVGDNYSIQSLAFSPHGNYIVVTHSTGQDTPGAMYVFSLNSLGEMAFFDGPLATGTVPYGTTAFSPIASNGVVFFSASNQFSNNITSYAFSLCTPAITPTINPENGASFVVNSSIALSGALSSGNTLTLSSSDTTIATVLSPATITGSTWATTMTTLAPGTVTILITATDCLGSKAGNHADYTVCADVVAPTISPASGSFGVGTSVPLSGTLSSGNDLTLSSSNTAIASVSAVTVVDTAWTATLTTLAPGSVTITATATNCAGSAAIADATYNVLSNGANKDRFLLTLYQAINDKYFKQQ